MSVEIPQSCFRTTTTTTTNSLTQQLKPYHNSLWTSPSSSYISTIHCFKEFSKPSYKPRKEETSIEFFQLNFLLFFAPFRENSYIASLLQPLEPINSPTSLQQSLLQPIIPSSSIKAASSGSLEINIQYRVPIEIEFPVDFCTFCSTVVLVVGPPCQNSPKFDQNIILLIVIQ